MRDKLTALIAAAEARNVVLEGKSGEDHVDVAQPHAGITRNYDALAYLQALSDRADTLSGLIADPV